MSDGLVLHYPFDVDEGSIAGDESGNGHTGMVCGATWTPEGLNGGAYIFDGENDWIKTSQDDQLNFDTNAFTLSVWIKTTRSAGQTMLFKGDPSPSVTNSTGYELGLTGDCDDDSDSGKKVTICHRPPGNPSNAKTIRVGAAAVDAHLAHGDSLGPCEDDDDQDSDTDSDSDSAGSPFGEIRDGSNATAVASMSTVNDDMWHHIACVRDTATDTLLLYVNGELDDVVVDEVEGSISNTFDVLIGRGRGEILDCVEQDDSDSDSESDSDSDSDSSECGCWFDGLMDDVRIYNRALTADEVEGLSELAMPIADVEANGSEETVSVAAGETLTLRVSLEPGAFRGVMADWWGYAETPSGVFHYNARNGKWKRGMKPSHQGPLSRLKGFKMTVDRKLPTGVSTVHFGVDLNMNGIMDSDDFCSETVQVDVRPR